MPAWLPAMAKAVFATATSGTGSVTYYESTGLTIDTVSAQGALTSPANVASNSVTATSGITTVAGANGAVVIAAGNTSGAGLTVTRAINTASGTTNVAGGSVLLEADGSIAITNNGTTQLGSITTTGNGSGAGGEVFLHHTNVVTGKDITLTGNSAGTVISAKGGASGNGAVVTLLNDAGNVVVDGGIDVTGPSGTDGAIQLQ